MNSTVYGQSVSAKFYVSCNMPFLALEYFVHT